MTKQNIERLTITELSPRIKTGKISPVELTELFLDRIKRLNPILNAYVTVTEGQAQVDAQRAEQEIRAGKYRGPLHGIPISIKDNIATKGVRTTAGSKILSEWKPDYDATVVARLKEAGAILLGKTNMHEWAAGGTTINPFYGATRNPWDLERIAGGSSGGSAAAVVAGLCMASIGTDNMGSVRNPAAICGIVGLKATYGRVSRFGGVPGTGGDSTDHCGVLTKTVEDCALVLEAIAGYDSKDPLSADEPVSKYSKTIRKKVKGLKVGLVTGYFEDLITSDVKKALSEALRLLSSLGIEIEQISIPHMDLIPALLYCTSWVENLSAHMQHLKTEPRDYSPGLLYRLIATLTVPAETYVSAQKVRRVICQEFDEVLKRVHAIIVPSVGMPAPKIEDCNRGFFEVDGQRISLRDLRRNLGIHCTMPFNLTGLPAISVCCGFSPSGLPVGLQIAAGPFREDMVFRLAHAYEQAAGWYKTVLDFREDSVLSTK